VRLSAVDLGLAYLLDDAEQDRAKTLRTPALRDRFMAGRIALRLHVSALTGDSPSSLTADYVCPSCRNLSSKGHGVPRYKLPSSTSSLPVSLSRAGEWCLIAASLDDDVSGVGVDIENGAAVNSEGIESVAMTPNERDQLRNVSPSLRIEFQTRLWVRKEAVLKALGTGLAMDPSKVDVSGATPEVLDEPPFSDQWHIEDIDPVSIGLPEDTAAACAIRRRSNMEYASVPVPKRR
jgi:4'-phosphopantetheinyl transferase